MSTPIRFSEDIEQIPVDEVEDIEHILDLLRRRLQRQFQESGEYRRDVHVKGHGCARGEFRVPAEQSAELSQGIFARSGKYPAFVRFSNSAPWRQPDIFPDGRGLAIQVTDLSAEYASSQMVGSVTQDFVMVNHSTFIAKNVKDYLGVEKARVQSGDHPAKLATALISDACKPFEWSWRKVLAAAKIAMQVPSHPASYTYFSMVPIRFGEYVAKYRVIPTDTRLVSNLRLAANLASKRDAMRFMLERTLLKQEVTFEFQVQLRTSEHSMPVEDATVEWPAQESPYRTAAYLVLPRQDLSQLSEVGECGRRSFSVWNGLLDHRPLGGINRLRRSVYPVSAACRHL